MIHIHETRLSPRVVHFDPVGATHMTLGGTIEYFKPTRDIVVAIHSEKVTEPTRLYVYNRQWYEDQMAKLGHVFEDLPYFLVLRFLTDLPRLNVVLFPDDAPLAALKALRHFADTNTTYGHLDLLNTCLESLA